MTREEIIAALVAVLAGVVTRVLDRYLPHWREDGTRVGPGADEKE